MERVNPATGLVTDDLQTGFNSKPESVFASTDLEETYQRMITKILESFAKYLKNGNGWRLKRVVGLDITASKLKLLKGSSHIPLPKLIARNKGLINIKNTEQQCFKWAITRALNPVERNPQRVTKILQKQAEKLNWNGISNTLFRDCL